MERQGVVAELHRHRRGAVAVRLERRDLPDLHPGDADGRAHADAAGIAEARAKLIGVGERVELGDREEREHHDQAERQQALRNSDSRRFGIRARPRSSRCRACATSRCRRRARGCSGPPRRGCLPRGSRPGRRRAGSGRRSRAGQVPGLAVLAVRPSTPVHGGAARLVVKDLRNSPPAFAWGSCSTGTSAGRLDWVVPRLFGCEERRNCLARMRSAVPPGTASD